AAPPPLESIMNKVELDVISPLPEGWGICLSCEMLMARANLDQAPYERGLDEYPPEWQEEFQRLSDTVFTLANRYGGNIMIRLWDPRSLQGLAKSIRYGVRRYPTFIVKGQGKVAGWDTEALERHIAAAGATPQS
ncbi:MAG: hypothetical protein ACOYYU_10915, partial [Chloroflexota bacterium]